MAGDVEIINSE